MGSETVHRLPIIVSGKVTDQLLSVQKLLLGTEKAFAVLETLESWSNKMFEF